MSKNLIAPLTALRFFAAAVVVWSHLQGYRLVPSADGIFLLFDGVSFFFVLSGFVLQHTYRNRIEILSWWDFFRLRLARIWPLHFITFTAALFVFSRFPNSFDQALKTIAGFSLFQSWFPEPSVYFVGNNVSWSLSCEMFFYSLFPIISIIAVKHPKILITAIIAALAVYILPWFWIFQAGQTDSLATGLFAVSPLVRIPEFIFGILLYEWRLKLKMPGHHKMIWSAAEIVSIVFIVALNYLIATNLHTLALAHYPLAVWLMNAGTAPAFAACILIFSYSNGAISKFLSLPFLVYLGEISFAIYLIHPLVIRYHATLHGLVGVVSAIIVLAALSQHLIERPIMRAVRRKKLSGSAGNDIAIAATG